MPYPSIRLEHNGPRSTASVSCRLHLVQCRLLRPRPAVIAAGAIFTHAFGASRTDVSWHCACSIYQESTLRMARLWSGGVHGWERKGSLAETRQHRARAEREHVRGNDNSLGRHGIWNVSSRCPGCPGMHIATLKSVEIQRPDAQRLAFLLLFGVSEPASRKAAKPPSRPAARAPGHVK